MASNEELALQVQAGDTTAVLPLWEQNRGLCHNIARRYLPTADRNKAVDMEDLMQAAFLGLHRAAHAYEADRGAFSTLLGFYIQHECQALLGLRGRERKEHYTPTSLDEPTLSDTGETVGALVDAVEDPSTPGMNDALELQDLRREVWEAVEELPDKQREVIYARIFTDHSLAEVGRRHGRTRESVRTLESRAFRTLRRNPKLKAYEVDYYRHKGISAFNNSRSSVVEDAVMWMERQTTPRGRQELRV